jgi:hypothetical protein
VRPEVANDHEKAAVRATFSRARVTAEHARYTAAAQARRSALEAQLTVADQTLNQEITVRLSLKQAARDLVAQRP